MIVILLLYLVLPAVQFLFYLQGRPAFGIADTFNYASSIFAFHWLLTGVALSSKVPRLQRLLPYDARIRFHIIASVGIVAFVAYHAIYKITSGKYIDALAWALLVVIVLMLLVAVLWIPLPGFKLIRSRLMKLSRLSLSYDRFKGLHGVFALTLSLFILLHVAEAGLFSDTPPFSAALYLALYVSSLGLYLLSRTNFFRIGATVLGVEERRGVLTMRLDPDRQPRYRSGQFAFVRVSIPSVGTEEHPFSYLSIPGEEGVSFAVRTVGDFTNSLGMLKRGDRVFLNGGYGNFRPKRESSLCFIASGIGTVPFISLLKELHASKDSRPLLFYLAVTHEDEIPDRVRLMEIAAEMPNLSLRILVFSVDGLRYSEDYFRNELPDPDKYMYYLCSSPGVRFEVLRSLQALGVRKSAIHYESFSFG